MLLIVLLCHVAGNKVGCVFVMVTVTFGLPVGPTSY